MWPSQREAALRAFPSPELCSSPIAPHQWWEWLWSCVWQHLPKSAHWPRSTVCPGWQWGRNSGSSVSGHAPYQLSPSDLSDICQSRSCDYETTSITLAALVLPVLGHTAVAVAHVALKFLGLPQSAWHVGGQGARGKPPWSFDPSWPFKRKNINKRQDEDSEKEY